jgi:hypothetical protein
MVASEGVTVPVSIIVVESLAMPKVVTVKLVIVVGVTEVVVRDIKIVSAGAEDR